MCLLRSICLICMYAFSNSGVNICIHLHIKLCIWNWYRCSLILKLHYTIGCTNDDFNDSDSEDDSDSDDDDNDDDHDDYDKDDNNSKNVNILMTIIMTLVMMMIITGMVIIICY